MNRYDRYPGDYLRDTMGLSMAQDGAYGRLMDHYYSTEKAIPDEEKFQIARAYTRTDKKITQSVLDRFFVRSESGHDVVWKSSRIEHEIGKALLKIETAKRNGARGGRPKKPRENEQNRNPVGSDSVNPRRTQQEPNPKPNQKLPSPSPSPSSNDDSARDPDVFVKCPPDLKLDEGQIVNLKMASISIEFIERATPLLRAKFASQKSRTRQQWVSSLVTAITKSWSDPERKAELLGKAPQKSHSRARYGGPVQPNHGKSTDSFLADCGHTKGTK